MTRLTLVDIGSRIKPMARKWSKARMKDKAPAKEPEKEPVREEKPARPSRDYHHKAAPIYKNSGRT